MQGYGARRRSAWLLGFALACVGTLGARLPAVRAEEAPTSVVDWLHEQGADASFAARGHLFEGYFPGETYGGTAEQNMRLLQALRQGAPAGPRAAPAAPVTAGSPTRFSVTGHGWRVTLDRGTQVLGLHVPERVVYEQQAGAREEPVHATPPVSERGTLFISAALLGAKAKQFDDGLYAAVEIATQRGHGAFNGRALLLESIRRTLLALEARGRGAAVLCAARDYAFGVRGEGLPAALAGAVAHERAAFEANPLRSKPIGFYTWSDDLFRIFRQDRMLQARLTERADVEEVARALRFEPWVEASYRRWLRLAARLTNPLVRPDVLQPPTPQGPSVRLPYHILPPSRAHETELAKRLWGGRPVPEGANLFDELIPRVRDGRVSLAPREDSGWYDHQTWALEPLLRPDAQPEAERLSFTPGYREHLEELFKGLLALTRETHIKQLEIPFCGACAPPPEIPVGTSLSVEPLATHYRRRADAYRFVRQVLDEAFGAGTLGGLRRLTIDGPVAVDLDTELDLMTRIFDGAAETALQEIGSSHADAGPEGEANRAVFRTWRALAAHDPDVVKDCRMMVPVFYDVERRKTKVWVFLGWQTRPLTVSLETPPQVLSWERLPGASEEQPQLRFFGQMAEIAYPVVAEVYVTELLDRGELRARCDRFKTRSAILAALR